MKLIYSHILKTFHMGIYTIVSLFLGTVSMYIFDTISSKPRIQGTQIIGQVCWAVAYKFCIDVASFFFHIFLKAKNMLT